MVTSYLQLTTTQMLAPASGAAAWKNAQDGFGMFRVQPRAS